MARLDAAAHLEQYAGILASVTRLEVTGRTDFPALGDLVGELLQK